MQHQRTIETILNLNSGEQLEADDLLADPIQNEPEIFQLREAIEKNIQTGLIEHVCAFCKQPVAVRGRKEIQNMSTHFFFAHLRDSDDCPIKTGSGYTREQLNCIRYNGVKESVLHETLKEFMAVALRTEAGVENVWVEKVYKNLAISRQWRKPDVMVQYGKRKIALELQLTTTYLSVIVGRTLFYREQGIFLVWVFATFSVETDMQKFTQKDVYYNNRFNVYVLDKDAQQKSLECNKLLLKCFYQSYFVGKEDELRFKWEYTFISLANLQFEETTGDCFYTNAEEQRKSLLLQIKLKKIQTVVYPCIQFIRKAYNQETILRTGPGYPLNKLDEETTNELNNQLKFKNENLDFIAGLFNNRVKKNFLRFICDEDRIHTDLNAIEKNNMPLLFEIVHLDNNVNFYFYIACLFRKGYQLEKKDLIVLENLYQKNNFNQSEYEKEQMKRWALCQLYENLSTKEMAFDVRAIEKIWTALASLKFGICVGYNFNNLLQLSHHILEYQKPYGKIYLQALDAFNQFDKQFHVDKKGKLMQKIQLFNARAPKQETRYNKLLFELFPEI